MRRYALVWALLLGCTVVPLRAQTTETFNFDALDLAIPDGNASGLSDRRVVTSSVATIADMRVRLRITGQFNGDLYAYLRHVQGGATNFCVLLNRPGRTATNPWGYDDAGLDVTLDDAAVDGDIHVYQDVVVPAVGTPLSGVWRPDGRVADPAEVTDTSPVSTFLGSFGDADPNGEWTLFVADLDSGATNMLVSWALEINGVATPDITWPTPADITYGTPLDGTQLNASSSVAGSFSYEPPLGTVLNAGPAQTLSATFTPTDTTSYSPVTTTVSIDVLPHELTITALDATKVYGAAVPALAADYAGFVNGDTPASLDAPVSLETIATPTSPVGGYPITPSGATDANYAVTFVAGTLTVAPAETTAVLASSANPAVPGTSLTFTFTLEAMPPGVGTPTGAVQFLVDGANVGAPATVNGGVASLSLDTLTAGWHTVSAIYAGDGNFSGVSGAMAGQELVNTPPTAGSDTVERSPTHGTKVLVTTLLSNDNDADGDTVQWLSVEATSSEGGTVTTDGEWVYYTPPSGFTNDDSFTYTIGDAYDAQATGTVTVVSTTPDVPSPNLVLTPQADGSYLLEFDGIPGLTYRIEAAESVSPTTWQSLGSGTADEFGMFSFNDTPPPGSPQRFYRSVYP